MRITNTMLNSKMLHNLNSNLNRLDKWQRQMSTGKQFNKPSDNPIGVSKSLELTTTLSEIAQHKSNANDAISWLEITESAVSEVGDILQRARELTVSADGTETVEDKQKIKSEIDQLKEQLIKSANTTYNGKHVFSGYKTNQKLLDDDGNYNFKSLDNEIMEYEIGIRDQLSVNTLGHKLFGVDDGTATGLDTVDTSEANTGDPAQLIKVFDELSNALDTDDAVTIDKTLGRLDNHIDNVLSVRGEIGTKVNRMELTIKRIDQNKINYTELLSKNEDADMAEVIMQMKMDESVYRASLSIGSKVIQPTLVDFIR